MSMYSERLQVLIAPEQRRRLEAAAAERGASVAVLVREAIDRTYPSGAGAKRAAADHLLSAEPMAVPADVRELRRELDERRGDL